MLKRFVDCIDEHHIQLDSTRDAIPIFVTTDFFTKKKESTQNNYLREIRKFVAYIYESEGFQTFPSHNIKDENEKLREIIQAQQQEQEDTSDQVYDSEYEAFLQRYKKIAGGQ